MGTVRTTSSRKQLMDYRGVPWGMGEKTANDYPTQGRKENNTSGTGRGQHRWGQIHPINKTKKTTIEGFTTTREKVSGSRKREKKTKNSH